MSNFTIRLARPDDQAAAYYVCLKTGDHGRDGESFYRDDPDALGRIFVGPYLAYEPELSLVVADEQGVCGYALAALDSRAFYARYDCDWRPTLCERIPPPGGDRTTWTRAETVHSWYHQPDYFCPEPYETYPSHMHIDLLQARTRPRRRPADDEATDGRARRTRLAGRASMRQLAQSTGAWFLRAARISRAARTPARQPTATFIWARLFPIPTETNSNDVTTTCFARRHARPRATISGLADLR